MSCLTQTQMTKVMDAVSGYCGAAPDPVKIHAIDGIVKRFCRDIGGIRTHLGPVSMTHDNGIYYAVAPFGGIVFDVKNVTVDGCLASSPMFKVFYRDDGRASVTFAFGARPNSALEMDVLWVPGERTTQMPDRWLDDCFGAIVNGVVAEVLRQVGTAWGNAQLAAAFTEDYAREVHDFIYRSRATDAPNGQFSSLDTAQHWI